MLWFWGIAIFVLSLCLSAAYFCYRTVFYNVNKVEEDAYAIPPGKQYQLHAKRMRKMIHSLEQVPFEQVCITASDGSLLAARYYHVKDGAPVQIQFHGYRGSCVREYAAAYELAIELGFNSLVVDERAHGKSSGHIITFGIKERYDCLDWIEYAIDRFGRGNEIILSGVSMGAATVLMASELALPDNVVAITADCPYSSPGAIIKKVCRDLRLPVRLAYPFVVLGALLFGHFRLWRSSAVEAVKHAKVPILLIHGEDDWFVPCDMSREIYAACASKKRLFTVPGAGHGLSYLVDTPGYTQSVKDFLYGCGIL